MKLDKRTKTAMRDRYNWLKAWCKGRQYDLGCYRNEFLYIYYTTARTLWSEQVSKDLLLNMNNQLVRPLEKSSLQKMIVDVKGREKPICLKNQDIIRRLGITAKEEEELQIGHNLKKVANREKNQKTKRNIIDKVEMMYTIGYSPEQIYAEFPEKDKRRIQRYISKYREANRSEEEKQALAEEVIRLYQNDYQISGIARRTGTTMDEVRRILNLDSMTKMTKQETQKDIERFQGFKLNGCSELFECSLHNEKKTQFGLDDRSVALDILRTYTNNVLLMGAAGTGKTTLIKEFLSKLPPSERAATLIVAPTGRAADHLDAQTIHKAFLFPNDVQPNEEITAAPKNLYSISRLIIDEANLVRIDVFSRIIKTIKHIEDKTKRHIQIILIADFGQIAPVAKDEDVDAINFYYSDPKGVYAFYSDLWAQQNFRTVILKQIHRQKDPVLIEKLNEIKYGKLSALLWFNQNAGKGDPDAIYICPTNKWVDQFNAKALEQFNPDAIKTYTATLTGGRPTEDLPCPEQLQLAVGMRVMTICNADQYKNGSMGEVIKTNDKSVRIKFDNGVIATVTTKKFTLQDGITFEQIPVVMAYAITANKAEGMTFDKINVVPGYFAPGQLYTALSRSTSLNGINIIGDLTPKDLRVDLDALKMTVDKK